MSFFWIVGFEFSDKCFEKRGEGVGRLEGRGYKFRIIRSWRR